MDRILQYLVFVYEGLHDVREEATGQAVMALSPEDAAWVILGQRLVRVGEVADLRAKVSYQDVRGPRVVMLYRRR